MCIQNGHNIRIFLATSALTNYNEFNTSVSSIALYFCDLLLKYMSMQSWIVWMSVEAHSCEHANKSKLSIDHLKWVIGYH